MLCRLSILILTLVFSSCVKDEGKVSGGNTTETTGGSSGGGATSGGTTSGSPATGSDPLASYAWHLGNTGQTSFSASGGVPGEDISVKYVHETLNILGRGVKIAVSDSGTELEHPDLDGNSLAASQHRNYTFSSSSSWHGSSPLPSDGDSHGTSVAGLISAEGWNGIGSRGVAPSSKFAAFRFIFTPSSSETSSSYLAKNIDQTYGNFDIFNYSYGRSGYIFFKEDETYLDAIEIGAKTLRNGRGALYLQSAGNSYRESYEVCDPALDPTCSIQASGNTNSDTTLSTPYKVVVAALNANGESSSYSTPGSSVWISAPGGEYGDSTPAMITTDILGCSAGASTRDANYPLLFDSGFLTLNPQCDYTSRFNGTSAASPVAAGVVALMLEANPSLTWRDVKHILAVTADKVDYDPFANELTHPWGLNPFGASYIYDMKWQVNAAGFLFSNWFGFGRVNAEEAVEMALTYNSSLLGTYVETKSSAGVWFYDSGTLIGKTIPDQSSSGIDDSIWVGHNYIIESVQISLTSDHPWPGDLAIHLVSPSGTESRLLTINNNIYSSPLDSDFIMLSNAFYGEESEGYWTIRIFDGDSVMGTGDLQNWKIKINGRRKTSDLSKPLPPTLLGLGTPANLSTTPIFGFTHSVSTSVTRYEAAVGSNFDNESIRGWTSIGLSNSGNQLTGLTLISGQTYYLKVRAVNSVGVSSVQLLPWTAP
jgi:subtilisin-like proprotein convertase family protein